MTLLRPGQNLLDWLQTTGLSVLMTVLGAMILARLVSWGGNKVTDQIDSNYQLGDALVRSEATKHRHSVAQVITWVVITFIYVIATLKVLDQLNLPIGSLVAPATVLGAALGFGAQRVVQDILAGFFIITERQYGFGDTVRLAITGSSDDAEGVIEDVTLRVTRMRNSDGEVITVPNGQIVKATNLSKDWARAVIDVPVPATADLTRVNEVLRQVGVDAMADRDSRNCCSTSPRSWASKAWRSIRSTCGWSRAHSLANSSRSDALFASASPQHCDVRGSRCHRICTPYGPRRRANDRSGTAPRTRPTVSPGLAPVPDFRRPDANLYLHSHRGVDIDVSVAYVSQS